MFLSHKGMRPFLFMSLILPDLSTLKLNPKQVLSQKPVSVHTIVAAGMENEKIFPSKKLEVVYDFLNLTAICSQKYLIGPTA
jgi:hypothetical protein